MENVVEYVKMNWEKLTAFSRKEDVKERLWKEIEYRYAENHRAYHHLGHIAYLFQLLNTYLGQIANPAVVGFAILYHDIVYDTYRKDNEEQSAAIATNHLTELLINKVIAVHIKTFILATKNHVLPEGYELNPDLAFFLDFDRAILGEDVETYKVYSGKIRKEYAQYTDDLYQAGRKQALQKFISSPHIYSTNDFRVVMEDAARKNIQMEIELL